MRATILLALTVLLAAACTPDAPAASEPTATATSEPTPSPTATRAPTAIPTPPVPDEPSPAPPIPALFRTHIVDISTAEVVTIYEGNQPYLLRDRFYPTFTPNGTAVWLSIRGWTGSKRFALDGTITDELEGAWGVVESPDTRSRTYYLYEEGALTTAIAMEHDGVATRIEGRHALPIFSPSSTELAVYQIDEEYGADLLLVDVETSTASIAALGVDPCPCDLTPHPDWAPSGDYIAYYDFSGNPGSSPMGWASFVLDLSSDAPRLVAEHAPPGGSQGWLDQVVAPDRLLVESVDSVSLFDARTGQSIPLFTTAENERYYSSKLIAGRYVRVHTLLDDGTLTSEVTTLFDGQTGTQLSRWEFWGEPMVMPAGLAIIANPSETSTLDRNLPIPCAGLLIQPPTTAAPECVEDGTSFAWSPDGSTLAIGSYDPARWLTIFLWDLNSGLSELAVLRGSNRQLQWNPQGTHLLVTDGTGL